MSQIFISYARKDLSYVRKIVTSLDARDCDVWIDLDDIPKGEDWEQEIYQNINKAEAFLFMLSPDSIASEMCNKEIRHAVENGKRILPIVVREAEVENFCLILPATILSSLLHRCCFVNQHYRYVVFYLINQPTVMAEQLLLLFTIL